MRKHLLLIGTIFFAFSVHCQNFVGATKSSDGQTITLANDEALEIKLPCNPSTGYGWYPILNQKSKIKNQKFNDGVITQTGDWEFIPDKNNGMVGQPGTEVIRFIGVSQGTSELTLEYKRPWEKNKLSVDIFKLSIISYGKYTGTTDVIMRQCDNVIIKKKSAHQHVITSTPSLPSSFSWQSYCTPIKDQESCGSCWAFASTGCFEAIINIIDTNITSLSEQWLINCSIYDGCQGGWCPNYLWVSPGAVYDSELPYADSTCLTYSDTAKCMGMCGTYPYQEKADSSAYIDNPFPTVDQIKQAIYNYGPVWVCVDVGINFESYTGGIDTNSDGTTNLNHAVVLVGWKDSTALSTGGYWILRNSWGNWWGEYGYMRIGYGVSAVGAGTNYIVYKGSIPCSGTPNPGNTVSSANPVCPSSPFKLSLQNTIQGSGVTYQWQSSPDSSAWSNIIGANTSTYITSQSDTTWYQCKVACSGDTVVSNPLEVTMNTFCYCLGSYSNCGTTNGIDITNVTFGTINNTTTANCNLPYSYNNYTGLSTTVYPGLSYPISLSSDNDEFPVYWGIWVDWNNSGSFTDSTNKYTLINNDYGMSLTGIGTIVVPAGATVGNHRMRIRANFISDPGQANACANLGYGEQEDYTVNVIPPCAGTPTPGSILSSANPVCSSASFTLSLQNATSGGGITYQWQSSPDNITWSTISGATYSTYVASQTDTTYYQCKVNCSGDTGISNVLKETVNPIPITPTIVQNLNELVSSYSQGNQWYDANGALSGDTSMVFTPSKDGTYDVIVTQNGCESKPSNSIYFTGAGINELTNNNEQLTIYPNPAKNELNIVISNSHINQNLEILNSIGKIVYKSNITDKIVVNVSGFAEGIYIVRLFSDQSSYNKKLEIIRR